MRYIPIFLPFVFSYLLQDSPTASYAVAWAGSLFILWYTLTGRAKRLPGGATALAQLFRPIVFTQIIFAGYNALTSIFYFLFVVRTRAISLGVTPFPAVTAEAQRYYVLGHAAVVTGILLSMRYDRSPSYKLSLKYDAHRMMLVLATVFFVLSLATALAPALGQLTLRLRTMAIVASVFSFALSLIYKEGVLVWVNAAVFSANLVQALLSGWKEDVLILLILFLALIFPYYRRAATIAGVVALGLFVFVMPAYTIAYRKMAWYADVPPSVAAKAAYEQVASGRINLGQATKLFSANRLSEIGLFVTYLRRIPEVRPFYGTQLIEQTAETLVPRLLWAEKPNTEQVVMQRVFENGVFSRARVVSAKPQFIVDGYLFAGVIGILASCLLYGILASSISRLAERWFGGYLIGSGLVYSSLFQIFWRGNAFEFFFASVFWSFVVMAVLHQLAVLTGFLVPVRSWPAQGGEAFPRQGTFSPSLPPRRALPSLRPRT